MSDFDRELQQQGITYRDRTARLAVYVKYVAWMALGLFASWQWWEAAHCRQKIYTPSDLHQGVRYQVSVRFKDPYAVTFADGPPNVGKTVYYVYLGNDQFNPNDIFTVKDGQVLRLVE